MKRAWGNVRKTLSHPTTQAALAGYGVFCVVNWGITYWAARSGSPVLFGSAGLLNLNETLRKGNVLSYLFDPLAAAERAGASHAPAPSAPAAAIAPPPAAAHGGLMPYLHLDDPTNWADSN